MLLALGRPAEALAPLERASEQRPTDAAMTGLLVERVGFLRDGRAVEFCQSWYRGDTYDFVAELSTE